VVSGGIFPETLFLTVLLKLSVPDSRKCLGKPRVNMKWNLNLEKNATTVETENHQKIPSEMVFCVWWHLSGNFVFTEPGRAG